MLTIEFEDILSELISPQLYDMSESSDETCWIDQAKVETVDEVNVYEFNANVEADVSCK